ncbi:MAG: 2-polyprenyl-3-methyl-6-methoxy-1,4-benzoquinone monooxygenase [Gammaproteobacteria bacterium]|nr:2-polyprenyl-3-methyl-6-methoxy-1,4-benzoquinone monooxygenase [Gammaproteobacteria bacterium]
MSNIRHYTVADIFCVGVDQVLRALLNNPKTTERNYPAQSIKDCELTQEKRRHSASLMRINHAGEVCAQALYHGQAIASRNPKIKKTMQQAAIEEGDHLMWCHMRLVELGSHTSYLNPIWYIGAFTLGLSAGLIGDQWSLGFLAETEKQVVEHLERHLQALPEEDLRSKNILQQMQLDEAEHRDAAFDAGAKALPFFLKKWMAITSKVMVKIAYWF